MSTMRAKLGRWKVGIAFGAVTLAFVIQGVLLARQIDRNATALTALCAQRHDLDIRILAEKGLLAVNHDKFIFRIPRTLIVEGLHRDQTTRQNLEILDCKETP